MRVLLCLPTGQHVPSLLAIHQFSPDHLVLLAPAAGPRACAPRRLIEALRAGGFDYSVRHEVETILNECEIAAVQKALELAYARHPDNEWVVNVSGGSKPTVIAAYQFFKERRATLVYANAARPGTVQFLDDGRLEPWRHRPSIREFLAGYGFLLLNHPQALQQAEAIARSQWECTLCLAERAAPEDVVLLDDEGRKAARNGNLELRPEQCGPPLRDAAVRDLLGRSFQLETAGGALQGKLSKTAGKFLTGEWLEVFFWNLLARHQEALGLWDVRTGLNVKSEAGVQNEFDVAFMHRFALNLIECKSGTQEDNPAAGVLYKVEAVTQQFRARRVRKFLATTAIDVLQKDMVQIKEFLITRAALYNCTILTHVQIRDLAGRHKSTEAVAGILGLYSS